jgi:hypothetical protein
MQEKEFELIHPNDLEYLARHGDLIIRLLAEWKSVQSIKIMVFLFVAGI